MAYGYRRRRRKTIKSEEGHHYSLETKFDQGSIKRDITHERKIAGGGVYQSFGSPEAFVAQCQKVGVLFPGSSWQSEESSVDAMRLTVAGDTKRVQKAEAISDKFASEIDLGQSWPQWTPDVCGSIPHVANYLAGVPETMWRRPVTEDDKAPITIWVCVTSSGGCEAAALERRGIAIQALAMALSITRQVKLKIFSGLDGQYANHLVSIELPSPPVLSQAAYMLASQGFSRGLTYQFLYKATGAGGGWPRDISVFGDYQKRVDSWKKLLPIEDVDLVFPHVFFSDEDYTDPIGYCKKIYDKVTGADKL